MMTQRVALPAHCVVRPSYGMAFTPDIKTLAVISNTGQNGTAIARLLDVNDLRQLKQLKCNAVGFFSASVAIDPSGRYLATALSGHKLQLLRL